MPLTQIMRKTVFSLAEARLFAARRCIAPVGRDHCGDPVVDQRSSRVAADTMFCVTHLAECYEEWKQEQ